MSASYNLYREAQSAFAANTNKSNTFPINKPITQSVSYWQLPKSDRTMILRRADRIERKHAMVQKKLRNGLKKYKVERMSK